AHEQGPGQRPHEGSRRQAAREARIADRRPQGAGEGPRQPGARQGAESRRRPQAHRQQRQGAVTESGFSTPREKRMAKGYLVTTYRKINDQSKWAAYAKLAGPAIEKAGGRFIVRGSPAQVYEKGVKERVVIVEFDSVQKVIAA